MEALGKVESRNLGDRIEDENEDGDEDDSYSARREGDRERGRGRFILGKAVSG